MRNGVLNNEGENAQRIENALSSDPFSSYWKSKVLVCGLFAVGLGNNKQKYTRAASLALAIAAVLESLGGEFLRTFAAASLRFDLGGGRRWGIGGGLHLRWRIAGGYGGGR